MEAPLTHAVLKEKQRSRRGGFPETMGLRVHRAGSWTGRARPRATTTPGSSSCGSASTRPMRMRRRSRTRRPPSGTPSGDSSGRVVALNAGQRIYDAIRDNLSRTGPGAPARQVRVQPVPEAPQRGGRIRGLGGMVPGVGASRFRCEPSRNGTRSASYASSSTGSTSFGTRSSTAARPGTAGSTGTRCATAPRSSPFSCPPSSTS